MDGKSGPHSSFRCHLSGELFLAPGEADMKLGNAQVVASLRFRWPLTPERRIGNAQGHLYVDFFHKYCQGIFSYDFLMSFSFF